MSRQTRNSLPSRRNGKREKWRENRGHVVTLAVRVSRKRDAKSLFCLL